MQPWAAMTLCILLFCHRACDAADSGVGQPDSIGLDGAHSLLLLLDTVLAAFHEVRRGNDMGGTSLNPNCQFKIKENCTISQGLTLDDLLKYD